MKLSQTPEGLALRNKFREDFEKALGLPPGAFGRVGPRPMTALERAEMLRSLLQHPEESAYRRIVKQTVEMNLGVMRDET